MQLARVCRKRSSRQNVVQASAALHSCGSHAAASSRLQAAQPLRPTSSSRRGRSVIVRAAADFYDILGVPRSADKKQIKQAYRQKARKFHPVSEVMWHVAVGWPCTTTVLSHAPNRCTCHLRPNGNDPCTHVRALCLCTCLA